MTFAIPFFDFEQVSAPAGLAAGGTSQCVLDYTRIVKVFILGLLSGGGDISWLIFSEEQSDKSSYFTEVSTFLRKMNELSQQVQVSVPCDAAWALQTVAETISQEHDKYGLE